MSKYALLRQRVDHAASFQNLELLVPHLATIEELRRAHNKEYVSKVTSGALSREEIRIIGFPWSPQLVHRSRRSCGATIEACRAALEDGYSVNLAGGTHHAFADHGEGYCVFNDSAVAALAMLAENSVQRMIVIDCDVHQGNGTAALFAEEPLVFTFSIHGGNNYPRQKIASDLDIGLPDGTEDETYLVELHQGLRKALTHARPDLAIYLAGADPYVEDHYGRLALTKSGLRARDRLVFDECASNGVPVAVTMAGGYAKNIEDIVDIHFQTVSEALFRTQP